MKRVFVLAFVMLASCSLVGGEQGTQECLGCRLQREVKIGSALSVLSESPTPCSEWVARHVAVHEHIWTRTGCWTEGGIFGNTISCLASPAFERVSSNDWLAYLQSLPEEARSTGVAVAAKGEAGTVELFKKFEAWHAQNSGAAQR